ncbi:MAG: AAC(3) family N-acetyltransferase [Deferrisomatales bacterium]|nr:AAC(3) family N-acetyltransferase [Deferrisomatales bacterium]
MLGSIRRRTGRLAARGGTRLRQAHLWLTGRSVSKRDLLEGLRDLGIERGDVIFVHSSLGSLGYVRGGPRAVIESLYEAVGPEGTLMVPTYFVPGGTVLAAARTPGYVFDPRRHGANLGALPSAFLKFPGIERSIHPTHSVSAVGKQARYVTEGHHRAPSIFGAGSPWDRLIELGGKVVGLGVSMGPISFYHVLQDRVLDAYPIPVHLKETFVMKCRDWDGNLNEVPVRAYDPAHAVRRIDQKGREDLRRYFWREFERAGLLNSGRVGEATAWFIPARQFYEHLHRLMLEGITTYSTPEEFERRPIS